MISSDEREELKALLPLYFINTDGDISEIIDITKKYYYLDNGNKIPATSKYYIGFRIYDTKSLLKHYQTENNRLISMQKSVDKIKVFIDNNAELFL